MASCSSSLALSLGQLLSFRGRLYLRPQAVPFRDTLVLKRATAKPCSRRAPVLASLSPSDDSTEIIDISSSSDDSSAPAVQPWRKRGRPRQAKNLNGSSPDEPAATEQEEEEEEEWDFFGELASHIETQSQRGWTEPEQEEEEAAPNVVKGKVVEPAADKGNGESIPKAASAVFGGGRQEEVLREEDARNGEDEEIDFDDPKFNQKPDWMKDADWEAINKQRDEDDEGQPLWVEEEDPSWPNEGEDGWGFRTSQFFDRVSIKSDEPADDDDDDDERLQMNWDSEADDWTIKEITSNEWEYTVFADPSPLVVYAFARYGRRGMDSWKMLEQLEKAVTSVWESGKAPLRAVKVDVGMEIDLGSALGIGKDECPQLLLIKNGKGLYHLKDQRNSEELMQLLAHFFYNGKRPSFVKTTPGPESLKSVA